MSTVADFPYTVIYLVLVFMIVTIFRLGGIPKS